MILKKKYNSTPLKKNPDTVTGIKHRVIHLPNNPAKDRWGWADTKFRRTPYTSKRFLTGRLALLDPVAMVTWETGPSDWSRYTLMHARTLTYANSKEFDNAIFFIPWCMFFEYFFEVWGGGDISNGHAQWG